MTTAVAMNAKEVIAQGVSLVQDIPLSRIKESKTNPRRQIHETKLAELVQGVWMRRALPRRMHARVRPILSGIRSRAGACERFQSHSLCHTL